jgi:hypothetical protein
LPRLLDGVLQSLRQLRRHGIGRSGQQADDTRRLRGEWTLDLHEDASILFSRILELAPYLLRYRGFLVFSTNIILFSSGHREGIAITPKNEPHADFSGDREQRNQASDQELLFGIVPFPIESRVCVHIA